MNDAQTKAGNLLSAQQFVRARFGDAAWTLLLARLTADDRERIPGLVAIGWIPVELYHRVVVAMDDELAAGRATLMEDFGRFAADHDLRTLHRALLRMVGASFSIHQFASLWPRYHDSGQWRFDREVSGREFVGRLEGWALRDVRTCRVVAGYIARLLELASGRPGATVEHPECLGRGGVACVFRGRWG